MKNQYQPFRWLPGLGLAMVVVGLTCLPSFAQVKGDGAAKMIQLKPIQTVADAQAVQPGDTMVTACPKCKTSWVSVVERPAKTGATPESKLLARHECPGCDTKLVTEGTGKQAKDVVKHVCKSCGSEDAFCCVMKKGASPTAGLEKK